MAKRMNFTRASIDAIKPPAAGRLWVYDTKVAGLAIMVTPRGSRSYYVYKRVNGRPQKHSYDNDVASVTIEQARQWAREELVKIGAGRNPNAERKEARQQATFGDAYRHYLANVQLKPRSKREDERIHDNHLEIFDRRSLNSLEKSEFSTLHARVSEGHGRYMANRVLEVARKVVYHAIKTMEVFKGENPAANFPRNKEHARKVYVDKREAPRLLDAIEKDTDPDVRDYLKLLLATGQRKTNVAEMKWADINLDRGTWRIKAAEAKGGDPIDVSLNEQALEVLTNRTKRHPAFVFANELGQIPYFRNGWERVRTAAGLTQLHLHDLRRTVGSWLAMSGVQEATIAKVLGHASGDTRVTKVYMQISDDAASKALKRVGNQIFGTTSKRKEKRAG